MADLKPRYTTRFLASAHLYTPPASEQMEAVASLDKLRGLLPPGIDPESHPTLLYVAGNLAVGNVINLNDDGLRLEDALRTYRAFEWQLVDIEHVRADIKGFIVKAGLSELGTDRLITEEEARVAGKPVNIAIVVALWKVADADLCAFIQQMDAPASPDKGKLSFSFEVGFDDYDIVVLPAGASNLALATQIVTPDTPEFGKLDRLLRVNGGKGVLGKDSRVARIIMGNIIPLGAGIVTAPAAAVKGLTTITTSPHVPEVAETDAGLYKYSSTQVTLSAEDAAPFLAYAAAIPDAHIFTDPEDPTLRRVTEDAHISILYGIHDSDPTLVQAALKDVGPMRLTFGEIAAFSDPERDYDVLHVAVTSPDLEHACALLTTAVQYTNRYVQPGGTPTLHLTLAYVRRGHTAGYIGDTRFKGRGLTFPSVSFCPHTGDRIEIPLKMMDGSTLAPPSPYTDQTGQVPVQTSVVPDTSMAQIDSDEVYMSVEAMATPSRQIKLSQGWQERLAALQAAAGKDPLVNGVTLTLSDGRKLVNVKVFDGATLELDKELSMSGVVITDMTPGAPMQADDPINENPRKALVYPTTSPEQQARDAAEQAKREAGQRAAYTDASAKELAASIERMGDAFALSARSLDAFAASLFSTSTNTSSASVSLSNPTTSSMNLSELKQSLAAVKTVEDLPTAVANVALFAEAISKASEQMAAERLTAQEAAKAAQVSLDEIKTQMATLKKTNDEMVAAQQAAAAEAKFNDRMNAVEAAFDLDDDIRAEIVAEIKACADDESFTKWLTSAKKKMKGWLKKGEKPGDKGKDKEPDGDDDDTKAALAAHTALASAAANIVDPPISSANSTFEETKTLVEQMKATFTKNISIGGVSVETINEKAKKK